MDFATNKTYAIQAWYKRQRLKDKHVRQNIFLMESVPKSLKEVLFDKGGHTTN